MNVKPKTNYWINFAAFICFITTNVSGIILGFFIPSGGSKGGWKTFLTIPKHSWKAIHKWSGLIFIILVLIHLIVHWRWIFHMTKKIFKNQKKQKI